MLSEGESLQGRPGISPVEGDPARCPHAGPPRFPLLARSTTFLVGPVRQLKYMFDRTRVIATIIYLGCLGATLWAGLTKQNMALIIFFLVLQFLALVWYTASYVPYARQAIQSCLCRCVGGGASAA